MTSLCIEHHPCDSRIVLKGGVVQTLNERMGTGGGNVPLVLEIDDERANSFGIEPESRNDNK